jgi:hypothetical protein
LHNDDPTDVGRNDDPTDLRKFDGDRRALPEIPSRYQIVVPTASTWKAEIWCAEKQPFVILDCFDHGDLLKGILLQEAQLISDIPHDTHTTATTR